MRALCLRNSPYSFRIEEISKTPLQNNQVCVKMLAAALNHRDEWIRQGKYAKIMYPAILGSDGCGVIESVANNENRHLIGQRVIINPNINWGSNPKSQSGEYSILGMPTTGTLQEYINVPMDRLHYLPQHLTPEQAAAIPLAGLTAFRALFTQGGTVKNQNVLITGIGGGVALFALQFAITVGARVFVTSGSEEKISKAIQLGAEGGINYKKQDWYKELLKISNGFDVIIDSAGGNDFNALLNVIKPGGTIVSYGATHGIIPDFDIRKVFWKQLRIQGSTMGSDEDFSAMLDFITVHQLVPVVDSIRSFADVVSAFDRMKESKQFGKLVLQF
ncbi:MAG: zinc-binding dehydrogenase [Bacteriodetes bacterium]|nr:zinc-binding dehydrogenase [Bacteroidota bacterium]